MDRTIEMIRPHLDDLPAVVVPEGYRLTTAAELENPAPGWARVLNLAWGDGDWTPAELFDNFVSKEQYDPEGAFFIMHGDEAVAAALAWLDEPGERTSGRVHWVGTLPEHRGKRLGRAVVVALLHYFKRRGLRKAILGTQGHRTPAVKLYLSLGFEPWPHNEEEEKIWATWLEEMGEAEHNGP